MSIWDLGSLTSDLTPKISLTTGLPGKSLDPMPILIEQIPASVAKNRKIFSKKLKNQRKLSSHKCGKKKKSLVNFKMKGQKTVSTKRKVLQVKKMRYS